MQTKSAEPAAHTGITKHFGMVFVFQAFGALFLAMSEQLYEGYFSLYLSIMAVICIVLAVMFCVPAAADVAIPESDNVVSKRAWTSLFAIIVVFTTFVLSTGLKAGPDVPYLTLFLRKELLGAITGALLVLSIASLVRMIRGLQGGNGAFILLAGLTLVLVFGQVWTRFDPLCAMDDDDTVTWPKKCPLPRNFDHNVVFTILLIVANVLAAEGVLRLMAAGSGGSSYYEIVADGRQSFGASNAGFGQSNNYAPLLSNRTQDSVLPR